ncbi:MAG: hypothetical protein VB858_10075, partial [Planctomycetaceae bacterium]
MSITFQCLCGKRLKAQESSAGKRTRCPQCGDPVGIPLSGAPAAVPVSRKEAAEAAVRNTPAPAPDRQSAAEMPAAIPCRPTTQDPASQTGVNAQAPVPYFMIDDGPDPAVTAKRRRPSLPKTVPETASDVPPSAVRSMPETAAQPLDESALEEIALRKRPRWHRLISRKQYTGPSLTNGTGDLVRTAAIPVGLAAGLTLTLGITAVTLPQAMQSSRSDLGLLAGLTAGFLLTAGYACSYFHQILVNAARRLRQPISLNPALAVRSGVGWAAAALAGPVLPAAGTYLYWLQIGLQDPVDWIIVAELIWITSFWMTASLLFSAMDSDWKSSLPHRVLRKVWLIPKSIAIHSVLGSILCTGTVTGITFS